jgi:hypothetical protein
MISSTPENEVAGSCSRASKLLNYIGKAPALPGDSKSLTAPCFETLRNADKSAGKRRFVRRAKADEAISTAQHGEGAASRIFFAHPKFWAHDPIHRQWILSNFPKSGLQNGRDDVRKQDLCDGHAGKDGREAQIGLVRRHKSG